MLKKLHLDKKLGQYELTKEILLQVFSSSRENKE